MIVDLITVEFMYGPIDGHVDRRTVTYPPGELLRIGIPSKKAAVQHVYQAREFVGDAEPLKLWHSQIIPRGESLYD
jgi:hypothetical protein